MNAVAFADVVSTVGFGIALGVVLAAPSRKTGLVSPTSKTFLVLAMGLYLFVGVSNLLEHTGIIALFDRFEDYAELLFLPLFAYFVHSMAETRRFEGIARDQRALRRSHELTMSIVETTPAGIMVVDPAGRVTFANDRARSVLRLTDDPDSVWLHTPGWTVRPAGIPDVEEHPDLRIIASGVAVSDVPIEVIWPDGRLTRLAVSVAPLADDAEVLGGSVVAFLETGSGFRE